MSVVVVLLLVRLTSTIRAIWPFAGRSRRGDRIRNYEEKRQKPTNSLA